LQLIVIACFSIRCEIKMLLLLLINKKSTKFTQIKDKLTKIRLPFLRKIYMQKTAKQYNEVLNVCRTLFINKMKDYGSAWRILRLPSLTDQIFIKAQRIRGLQQNAERKVDEGEESEFIGIINYSIMALIQLEKGVVEQPDLNLDVATLLYDEHFKITRELMEAKNHDYGEAWREMRISSLTDLILQKLLRVKQIEDNEGQTLVSEGIDANYQDMINYSVFALILLKEQEEK